MENQSEKEIKKKYKIYLADNLLKHLNVRIITLTVILSIFLYLDITSGYFIGIIYTRILPLSIILFLFLFRIFVKNRNYAVLKIYNVLLLSFIVMMLAKWLIRLQYDDVYSMVSGIILVYFLVSLDIKTSLVNTILIYFAPLLLFVFILIFFFEIPKEQYFSFVNVFATAIIGFVVNRIQNRLYFREFKLKFLLEKQKQEIEQLYEETLTINENLSQRNEEISNQKEEIEENIVKIKKQQKKIDRSINYAKKIQDAMLPSAEIFGKFKDTFHGFFIFYKPRDVISGDFYWAEKVNNKLVFAVADCTGHGVPGAMLSMLGISLLNKIIMQNMNYKASDILEQLRIEMKKSLNQFGENLSKTKDGMDIALCIIDTQTKEMQFSGAYNPIYIYRENKLIHLKADRQPIGLYINEKDFTNQELQLKNDDIIYSFTDGFVDQFNPNGEKYMIKRFKEFLLDIAQYDLQKQQKLLENEFETWKSTNPQMDDVIVTGIKI